MQSQARRHGRHTGMVAAVSVCPPPPPPPVHHTCGDPTPTPSFLGPFAVRVTPLCAVLAPTWLVSNLTGFPTRVDGVQDLMVIDSFDSNEVLHILVDHKLVGTLKVNHACFPFLPFCTRPRLLESSFSFSFPGPFCAQRSRKLGASRACGQGVRSPFFIYLSQPACARS